MFWFNEKLTTPSLFNTVTGCSNQLKAPISRFTKITVSRSWRIKPEAARPRSSSVVFWCTSMNRSLYSWGPKPTAQRGHNEHNKGRNRIIKWNVPQTRCAREERFCLLKQAVHRRWPALTFTLLQGRRVIERSVVFWGEHWPAYGGRAGKTILKLKRLVNESNSSNFLW